MTTTEEGYREFVAARWPDLEAVARIVVLEPTTARRVTTDALARLSGRWREAVEDGRPAERARRDVLVAAVAAAAPAPRRPTGTVGGAPAASGGRGRLAAQPIPLDDGRTGPTPERDDDVVTAMTHHVVATEPVDRALLAARVVWDLTPAEVADLLSLPPEDLEARDARLTADLRAVHDDARRTADLEPAPWALERDLDDALLALDRGHDDPPDPAALVSDRAGGLRRRRLLVGGAAATALAAAGWWVVGSGATGPRPAPGLPRADDPVWQSTRRWPARGSRASDTEVAALVIGGAPEGSRLLFAGDVGDRMVVVASPADLSGRDGVRVVVWTGPRGAAAGELEQLSLARDGIPGVRDVVALIVGQDVGDALLVLTSPRLDEVQYAPVVVPSPDGGSVRTFTALPLANGVGTELVGRGLGPGTFVSAGGYQGIPAGAPRYLPGIVPNPAPGDYARECAGRVSELTGVPDGALEASVVAAGPCDGGALDPEHTRRLGRVVVVHVRTPQGAVVRSVRVTTRGDAATSVFDAESAAVVAADEADGPVFVRLPRSGRTERFLAVVAGAARVRLLSSAGNALPATRWVRCTGDSAVLTVPDARQEARYRLLAEDGSGETLFSGLPPTSSELV